MFHDGTAVEKSHSKENGHKELKQASPSLLDCPITSCLTEERIREGQKSKSSQRRRSPDSGPVNLLGREEGGVGVISRF